MNEITTIILCTLAAGACIPFGGLLARMEKIRPRWLENELRHGVIAFGGGILVAAVALVLVPEGQAYINNGPGSTLFLIAGGVCFFALEKFMGTQRRQKPQLLAMLLDYVPESLALGGAFAAGSHAAPLLALFIGLQNIPEGFNAFRELCSDNQRSPRQVLWFMTLLVPIGPAIGLLGWSFFGEQTLFLGAIMLFASGGILYLIFQDIAPQSRMRNHWFPPLGAVLGFGVGMVGNSLLH